MLDSFVPFVPCLCIFQVHQGWQADAVAASCNMQGHSAIQLRKAIRSGAAALAALWPEDAGETLPRQPDEQLQLQQQQQFEFDPLPGLDLTGLLGGAWTIDASLQELAAPGQGGVPSLGWFQSSEQPAAAAHSNGPGAGAATTPLVSAVVTSTPLGTFNAAAIMAELQQYQQQQLQLPSQQQHLRQGGVPAVAGQEDAGTAPRQVHARQKRQRRR